MSLGLERETVVTLLRIALTRQHYDFKSVCFFAPIDGEAGVLHVLFPPQVACLCSMRNKSTSC
jgi:hypothetical protein